MADPARSVARVLPLALYVSARDVQQQLGVGLDRARPARRDRTPADAAGRW